MIRHVGASFVALTLVAVSVMAGTSAQAGSGLAKMSKSAHAQVTRDLGEMTRNDCRERGHFPKSDRTWAVLLCEGIDVPYIVFAKKLSSGWASWGTVNGNAECNELATELEDLSGDSYRPGRMSSEVIDDLTRPPYCSDGATGSPVPTGAKARCLELRSADIAETTREIARAQAAGRLAEAALLRTKLSSLRASECVRLPDYSAGTACFPQHYGYSDLGSVFVCTRGVWRRW
jgi:hypothetical protein